MQYGARDMEAQVNISLSYRERFIGYYFLYSNTITLIYAYTLLHNVHNIDEKISTFFEYIVRLHDVTTS
jgi:hypothetical protein